MHHNRIHLPQPYLLARPRDHLLLVLFNRLDPLFSIELVPTMPVPLNRLNQSQSIRDHQQG